MLIFLRYVEINSLVIVEYSQGISGKGVLSFDGGLFRLLVERIKVINLLQWICAATDKGAKANGLGKKN